MRTRRSLFRGFSARVVLCAVCLALAACDWEEEEEEEEERKDLLHLLRIEELLVGCGDAWSLCSFHDSPRK
ncbi:hypothetical protein T484DRAFT_1851251 [Baffinella frigidus]|nr:hypothetical protein T484DRAFT_1851251 [Cryptophyta sp. CCMP2293]